jgi:hypothetical protein
MLSNAATPPAWHSVDIAPRDSNKHGVAITRVVSNLERPASIGCKEGKEEIFFVTMAPKSVVNVLITPSDTVTCYAQNDIQLTSQQFEVRQAIPATLPKKLFITVIHQAK